MYGNRGGRSHRGSLNASTPRTGGGSTSSAPLDDAALTALSQAVVPSDTTPKWPCILCKGNVCEGETGVMCEGCQKWSHSTCLKWSPEQFNFVSSLPGLHYYCSKCNKVTKLIKRGVNSPATAGQVADLTEKIEAFFGMDDDRCGSDGDETSGDDTSNPLYSTIVAKKLAPPVPSKFVHNLRAIDESDRKRRCVVVSGLPENGTDRDDVLHLVQSLDRSAEVADFFRMGRLEAPTAGGVQKPRLMKVCFSASDVARSVLSQARLLKTVPALSAQYKDVFIRRSMTREERDYLYKLRMERNRLNTANDTATTGINYAIVRDFLTRFTGCIVGDDGRISGGQMDRSFWSPLNKKIDHSEN